MNIEKGKKLFFKYYGSHYNIEREVGNEYKKCKIPESVEKQWQEEIKNQLSIDIHNCTGINRLKRINSYLQITDESEAIEFLIDLLENFVLDTFSRIIITENLKYYGYKTQNIDLKEKIIEEVNASKNRLLNSIIEVDQSYKESPFMQTYDFSEEAIISRINKI